MKRLFGEWLTPEEKRALAEEEAKRWGRISSSSGAEKELGGFGTSVINSDIASSDDEASDGGADDAGGWDAGCDCGWDGGDCGGDCGC